ncbi:MAG: histidine phosphatase family protein [Cyclobacteriaceae bacterium]|nr:histidine phosphatase family protein [Cyclobacteriaceae bacterium]
MKTLFLVRHAKSSWDEPNLADHDRPLNKRGNKDAPRMAKRLKEREVLVDLMVSSTATRALDTCKIFAEKLKYQGKKIVEEKKLYHASPDEMLRAVRQLPDENEHVFLFGHNPGLTEFANNLSGEEIMNVPTCGIVEIHFDVDSWQAVRWKSGRCVWFDFPKSKSD